MRTCRNVFTATLVAVFFPAASYANPFDYLLNSAAAIATWSPGYSLANGTAFMCNGLIAGTVDVSPPSSFDKNCKQTITYYGNEISTTRSVQQSCYWKDIGWPVGKQGQSSDACIEHRTPGHTEFDDGPSIPLAVALVLSPAVEEYYRYLFWDAGVHHDHCYHSASILEGKNKDTCDTGFKNDMNYACHGNVWRISVDLLTGLTCEIVAELYYQAMHRSSGSASAYLDMNVGYDLQGTEVIRCDGFGVCGVAGYGDPTTTGYSPATTCFNANGVWPCLSGQTQFADYATTSSGNPDLAGTAAALNSQIRLRNAALMAACVLR